MKNNEKNNLKPEKWYVTTPIYYVTAAPHLGSLYSTLLADVIARWQKLLGKDVFFLTGTDEHGQKIAQAAEKAGKEPKQFVDSFISTYQDVWKLYEIEYSKFIRTTDSDHKQGALALVQQLIDSGDIYKAIYEGWYCVPCETFITEKEVKQESPLCPSCGRETVKVSEPTYFFKLSAYQDKLLEFYKNNPEFILPKERSNEVLRFVQDGLKDLSISRTTITWGIPFPNDPEHIIYVWVEALCNYISAIGFGNPLKQKEFNYWWPADTQILGKDIIRFHAVFWPAFLMAAKLPLPKQLLVHGWIKVNKQKMSKSLGNVVDPVILQKQYGTEPVRYYLVRQMAVNQDGDFSTQDLEQRINTDLANDLGNLLQRMLSLAEKNQVYTVAVPPIWSEASLALRSQSWDMLQEVEQHMRMYEFHLALAQVWKFINKVNAYFHEQEPWKLFKTNPVLAQEVLSATAHSLRTIAMVLWPIMPQKMEQLLFSLGIKLDFGKNTIHNLELGRWHQTFNLTKIPALFEKIEIQSEEKKEESTMEIPEITIDELSKVHLVVGTIVSCEQVQKSDKLLMLQVDCGAYGKRQILSGIAQSYKPEALMNKQALFVLNLKPRTMMGLLSQGMLLVAEKEDGTICIMEPEVSVANGMRLR